MSEYDATEEPITYDRRPSSRRQLQGHGSARFMFFVALAAGVLWWLTIVGNVYAWGVGPTGGWNSEMRLVNLVSAFSGTWGYALVAVVAYVASLWLSEVRGRNQEPPGSA